MTSGSASSGQTSRAPKAAFRPVHLKSGQRTFGSMAACFTSSGVRRWKRLSPAPRAVLRMFFVDGSGPAHTAPPVKPPAQPFSPPARPTAGARIKQCSPTGCQQAVHQCQTHGDAHEATRAGRAPAGRRKSLGLERSRPGFEAPGTGLPSTAHTPRAP